MSLNSLAGGHRPVHDGEYVQDRRHVLKRNPNYRGEPYPCEGMPGDREAGLLADCGKTMPFIDTIVVDDRERERCRCKAEVHAGLPRRARDRAHRVGRRLPLRRDDSERGRADLPENAASSSRGTDISNWYLGFNWLDPVRRAGRHAASSTSATASCARRSRSRSTGRSYGRIFPKKGGDDRDEPAAGRVCTARAQGTVDGDNPITHKVVDGKYVRRSIDDARSCSSRPAIRTAATRRQRPPAGAELRLPARRRRPSSSREIDWMVKQFAKLGIQLEIRATDYNQFQDKMRKGKHQIFWCGWNADYPDAENFLFLLYGPNSNARKSDGENTANYQNPEYDSSTASCRRSTTAPRSRRWSTEMVAIVQRDAPWCVRLLPVRLGRLPALGLQRQAEHRDPRHGEVLPRRPRRGAARSRPNGTSRCGGRWRCWPCWRCWLSPGRRSARFRVREPRTRAARPLTSTGRARPRCLPHAELHRPPAATAC